MLNDIYLIFWSFNSIIFITLLITTSIMLITRYNGSAMLLLIPSAVILVLGIITITRAFNTSIEFDILSQISSNQDKLVFDISEYKYNLQYPVYISIYFMLLISTYANSFYERSFLILNMVILITIICTLMYYFYLIGFIVIMRLVGLILIILIAEGFLFKKKLEELFLKGFCLRKS